MFYFIAIAIIDDMRDRELTRPTPRTGDTAVTTRREQAHRDIETSKTLTDSTASQLILDHVETLDWMDGDDLDSLTLLSEILRDHGRESGLSYASTFETIVREEIPGSVWVYLGGQLLHA